MTDLSPAAQAVLDAFVANWQDEPVAQDRHCLADALRALAVRINGADGIRQDVLDIVNELEAQ
jgi:hypothetical protein